VNSEDAMIYAENYVDRFFEDDFPWAIEDVRVAAREGYEAGWNAARESL
jgi:hypothetical protein